MSFGIVFFSLVLIEIARDYLSCYVDKPIPCFLPLFQERPTLEPPSKVLFIDTEDTFSAERVYHMAQASSFNLTRSLKASSVAASITATTRYWQWIMHPRSAKKRTSRF
jgi:hypothetical protein